MSERNVVKLMEKIIDCLKDMYDYKIQAKWGQKILIQAIDQLKMKNPGAGSEAARLKTTL
jgi:hypothetical protein